MHSRPLTLGATALLLALTVSVGEITHAQEKPQPGLIFFREGEEVYKVTESAVQAPEPVPAEVAPIEPPPPPTQTESVTSPETDNEWAPPTLEESKEAKESRESDEATAKKAASEKGGIDVMTLSIYGGGSLFIAAIVVFIFLIRRRKGKKVQDQTASPMLTDEPQQRSDRLEKALEAMKEAKT